MQPIAIRMRDATLDDLPVLVRHRRWMFEEMNTLKGNPNDAATFDAMDEAYARHAALNLASGTMLAWVFEADGRVVASGAVSVYGLPPRPDNFTEKALLLHSIYTDPLYRRRGLARQIVSHAIDVCRAMGVPHLTLHASDAGRPLYESMGFHATGQMRLDITIP